MAGTKRTFTIERTVGGFHVIVRSEGRDFRAEGVAQPASDVFATEEAAMEWVKTQFDVPRASWTRTNGALVATK